MFKRLNPNMFVSIYIIKLLVKNLCIYFFSGL